MFPDGDESAGYDFLRVFTIAAPSATIPQLSGIGVLVVRLRAKALGLVVFVAACFVSGRSVCADPQAGELAVRTALRFRGVRYRYAGMSSRGMDCSGLVARVLMAHGIRAPHSSQALSRMGKAVGLRELKAGDLVFFRTRGRRISHVGMYVGDGKFVHAASRVRRVVVEKLNGGYYERRFVCARRVF